MKVPDFPGAKWWKFDFHTHTPASDDFQDKNVTPEVWLRQFMEKGVDCVAVTDHNSGGWIDPLKDSLEKIKNEAPEWYRPLYLFPGVELSVHSGIHILALFDPDKTTGDIDSLLGRVDYSGNKGKSDGVTKKSATAVIDEIAKSGGIAIPAHVDKEKGLFGEDPITLEEIFKNRNVYAMELRDEQFEKPQTYTGAKIQWAEVCGSDTHGFDPAGSKFATFTWVKMGEPSLSGLKLALIDGQSSINRDMEARPNKHAGFVIESLTVKDAKYMGRGDAELLCQLSPFLNTVIGGRGSGKSTLLEFIRLVLRRDKDLPEGLDQAMYFSTDREEGGLLTENSELCLEYRKDDTRYRLHWKASSSGPSIEEQQESSGEWRAKDFEIASLFPVTIYSQKQIYEMARKPQSLLRKIDEASEVDHADYLTDFQSCKDFCNRLRNQANELRQRIGQEKRLKGGLTELNRQIAQIEKSGHREVLQRYQLRRGQLLEIEAFEQRWKCFFESLDEQITEVYPSDIYSDIFEDHPEIQTVLDQAQEKWSARVGEIRKIIKEQHEVMHAWATAKAEKDWMRALHADLQQYDRLRAWFREQGIDPQSYPTLLQRRTATEKELAEIQEHKQQLDKLKTQYPEARNNAQQVREALTERRAKFLKKISEENQFIEISVKGFDEPWEDAEKTLRRLLNVEGFEKDFRRLKELYQGEQGWRGVKKHLREIGKEKRKPEDKRFRNYLSLDVIFEIDLWFPEDALQIKHGEKKKNIEQGSPGEKSVALLSFILAYGKDPLILDQPEDDLDNDLIYELIVQSIKEIKRKRQLIVATHNANIVVNGDSEMVHCMEVRAGQSYIRSDSLQSEETREHICNTMEGGPRAFEQRYRRIHLTDGPC